MKESDIRSQELLARYLELSRQDAQSLDSRNFQEIDCPGCGTNYSEFHLEKHGFTYRICQTCGSVFCSPRPIEAMLKSFYENSPSSKYWATVFFPAVAEIRKEKLFKKKANAIATLLKQQRRIPENICDAGAGYGFLLKALQTCLPESNFFAIEPNPELAAQCRSQGLTTLETLCEEAAEWSHRFDLTISQEVIEHVYSTENFIKSLYQLIKKGGSCLVTGLGYEGFDILTLQQHSNSISPPHHINFLSIKGFELLFKRSGFTNIQVWTPGELDVDIVANSPNCPEFITTLLERSREAKDEFQSFLQKYKLSSHVWVYKII